MDSFKNKDLISYLYNNNNMLNNLIFILHFMKIICLI